MWVLVFLPHAAQRLRRGGGLCLTPAGAMGRAQGCFICLFLPRGLWALRWGGLTDRRVVTLASRSSFLPLSQLSSRAERSAGPGPSWHA